MATPVSASSPRYKSAEYFAKRVANLTDNKFQIQVFAAGELVPGLQALDAVSSAASEQREALGAHAVDVVAEGDDVSISNGRSHFTVRPLSFDDYPKLASPVNSSVTLPAAQFGDAGAILGKGDGRGFVARPLRDAAGADHGPGHVDGALFRAARFEFGNDLEEREVGG